MGWALQTTNEYILLFMAITYPRARHSSRSPRGAESRYLLIAVQVVNEAAELDHRVTAN